jgi:hypothetical protein
LKIKHKWKKHVFDKVSSNFHADRFKRIRADELFDLDLLDDLYEHIPIDSEDY